jgi:ribosomal protein S18 acetylase RimI-like enzyme
MNTIRLSVTCILFSIFASQATEITIRLAESKDLPFLKTLSKRGINEDFRNTLIDGYPASPVIQSQILLDTYLTNMTTTFEGIFESIFEEKQLQDNRQRLFVAVQNKNDPTIVGLCFSQQISDCQAYIRYLVVDKDCRHQGIGSSLLMETLNSYENITSCELKTFAHANDKVQAFYEKHGFVSDKIPAPLQKKYSEHSDSITFVLYHLDINK